jgi:hypothetical protein
VATTSLVYPAPNNLRRRRRGKRQVRFTRVFFKMELGQPQQSWYWYRLPVGGAIKKGRAVFRVEKASSPAQPAGTPGQAASTSAARASVYK